MSRIICNTLGYLFHTKGEFPSSGIFTDSWEMANVGASFLGPEVKRLEGVQGIRYVYDPLGPKYLEHLWLMLLFTGNDTSKGCLSTTKWLDEYHPIYLWSISMLCNPIKRKSVIIRMKAMHIPKYLTTSPKILYLCSCYVKLSRSHCHCLDILADYLVERQLYLIFSIWMNVHIPYMNALSYPTCLSQHNHLKTYKELFCTFIILRNTVWGKGSILLPKA